MSIIKRSFALWCGRQIAFSVTVRTSNYFMYCKDIFENLLAEFNYTFATPGMLRKSTPACADVPAGRQRVVWPDVCHHKDQNYLFRGWILYPRADGSKV